MPNPPDSMLQELTDVVQGLVDLLIKSRAISNHGLPDYSTLVRLKEIRKRLEGMGSE